MRIPLCPAPTLISIVPDLVLSYGLALACALSYNSSNIGKHDPPTSTHHQLWIMQISKGTSLSRNSMSLSVLLFLTSFIRNSFVLDSERWYKIRNFTISSAASKLTVHRTFLKDREKSCHCHVHKSSFAMDFTLFHWPNNDTTAAMWSHFHFLYLPWHPGRQKYTLVRGCYNYILILLLIP